MKAESWGFLLLTAFFVIVAPIYWLVSHEIIGTVALLLTLAFCAMIASYLGIQARKIDPRPEDRKDAEIVDGAGAIGFFPSESIWPFWTAMAVTVMALGPVFGWWLTLLGVGIGIWGATGWCYQYYRGHYQH